MDRYRTASTTGPFTVAAQGKAWGQIWTDSGVKTALRTADIGLTAVLDIMLSKHRSLKSGRRPCITGLVAEMSGEFQR
jgi:hypothetical protein